MAHSNFKTNSSDTAIESYQTTQYKVRLQRQVYTASDASVDHSAVNTGINTTKNKLNNIINACSNAKAKCGTSSLSIIRSGSSTETNEFPALLDELSSDASSLMTKLETMKTSINEIITQASGLDNSELNKWLNSPDNPKNKPKETPQPTSQQGYYYTQY